MALTALKEKGQITLPSEIRKQLRANKGDLFDCEIVGGKVIMTLQKIVPATNNEQNGGVDISKYIGATAGTFDSANLADEHIRRERDKWD